MRAAAWRLKGGSMTLIATVSDGKRVVMGGDSAASSFGEMPEIYTLTMPKVFRAGPYALGFTTSYRFGQILRYHVSWPEPPPPGADLFSFVVTDVVEAMRTALRAHGALGSDGRGEKGGMCLFAIGGKIFGIADDFKVMTQPEPFAAIGAARLIALGSLYSTQGFTDLTPEQRVRLALEAAQTFSPAVREPFTFVTTEPEE